MKILDSIFSPEDLEKVDNLDALAQELRAEIKEIQRKLDELGKIQQILSHMQADIDWIKNSMKK